jgi:hypothetical protein
MLQLSPNTQELLTNKVWNNWQNAGYTTKPNALTWVEVNNLSGHFLKTCRDKQLDCQDFDFQNIIDHDLNYYENQSAIDEAIGAPATDEEDYKKYMADIADQAESEIKTANELTEKNLALEKQNKKLKAKEQETIDTQQLKSEIKQINDSQAAILNKLEQIPNIAQQIEALKKSDNFKALGNALNPIANPPSKPVKTLTNDGDPSKPAHYTYHGQGAEYCKYCGNKIDADTIKCPNCGAPVKEDKTKTLSQLIPNCFKPKAPVSFLDAFAGAMVTLIWIAVTYAALTSGAVTWITVIAVAFWWLLFVVVFRITVGGLLN